MFYDLGVTFGREDARHVETDKNYFSARRRPKIIFVSPLSNAVLATIPSEPERNVNSLI